METSEFRLREKTAVIHGPLTRVNQSIANRLSQLGADVVLADAKIDTAQRLANQIMESREINEKFGRAAAVATDFTSSKSAQDGVSRCAEIFGGIDIFVDGSPALQARPFSES